MTITVYGIKNCNTMKKAFTWLDDHNITYTFHDYKKLGADKDVLIRAIDEHGWETVINRKGMTWRALPDDIKNVMDQSNAIDIALEKPSIIKRPLLSVGDKTYVGFTDDMYEEILNKA